mgnify:CR=1 FL=1
MSRTSFKLFWVFIFFIFGFQSETTFSQSNNETYFSSLEYRLLGPFVAGEALQLREFLTNPIYFILEQQVVEFGKQKMVVASGKIFQMDFLVALSAQ